MLRILSILILSLGLILNSSVAEVYNGVQYIFSTTWGNWYQAYQYCNALQADLLFIETEEENNYVTNLVKTTPGYRGKNYWIGATDLGSNGYWYWLATGKDVESENWASGAPKANSREHCAHLWIDQNYKWKNNDCNMSAGFICKSKPCIAPKKNGLNIEGFDIYYNYTK